LVNFAISKTLDWRLFNWNSQYLTETLAGEHL